MHMRQMNKQLCKNTGLDIEQRGALLGWHMLEPHLHTGRCSVLQVA